jgi:general secretion pathway protein D
LQYGVQWYLAGLIGTADGSAQANGRYNYTYPPGSNNNQDFTGNSHDRHRSSLGALGKVGDPFNGGLFYSFLNKNMEVALSALQTSGTTKVLSTPALVVMNNQNATITVGQQVPVTSTSFSGNPVTNTSTSGNTTTSTANTIAQASYISTGVTLDITPRVNPGGLVYMDVSQEDSSPGTSAPGQNPPISQRNLKTQVAVQSGETVLLGGMISETDRDSKNGVPLLSSIPLIGSLFGTTEKSRDRTELIVLITPRVVTNPDEAREMTQEYKQKFESLRPLHTANQAAAQPVAPAQPAPQPAPAEQPQATPAEPMRSLEKN